MSDKGKDLNRFQEFLKKHSMSRKNLIILEKDKNSDNLNNKSIDEDSFNNSFIDSKKDKSSIDSLISNKDKNYIKNIQEDKDNIDNKSNEKSSSLLNDLESNISSININNNNNIINNKSNNLVNRRRNSQFQIVLNKIPEYSTYQNFNFNTNVNTLHRDLLLKNKEFITETKTVNNSKITMRFKVIKLIGLGSVSNCYLVEYYDNIYENIYGKTQKDSVEEKNLLFIKHKHLAVKTYLKKDLIENVNKKKLLANEIKVNEYLKEMNLNKIKLEKVFKEKLDNDVNVNFNANERANKNANISNSINNISSNKVNLGQIGMFQFSPKISPLQNNLNSNSINISKLKYKVSHESNNNINKNSIDNKEERNLIAINSNNINANAHAKKTNKLNTKLKLKLSARLNQQTTPSIKSINNSSNTKNITNFFNLKNIKTITNKSRQKAKEKEKRQMNILDSSNEANNSYLEKCSEFNYNNFINFDHVFEDNYFVYAFFEYMKNSSLLDLIKKRKRLDELEIRILLKQLSEKISHLHKKNIIHCNIKLSTLFLDGDYEVKIGGFWLAKICQFYKEAFYHGCVGSCEYLAPEMLCYESGFNYKADVWSLGVVIFVLRFGYFPFKVIIKSRFCGLKIRSGKITRKVKDELSDDIKAKNKKNVSRNDNIKTNDWVNLTNYPTYLDKNNIKLSYFNLKAKDNEKNDSFITETPHQYYYNSQIQKKMKIDDYFENNNYFLNNYDDFIFDKEFFNKYYLEYETKSIVFPDYCYSIINGEKVFDNETVSVELIDLLYKMLDFNPDTRIEIEDILSHQFLNYNLPSRLHSEIFENGYNLKAFKKQIPIINNKGTITRIKGKLIVDYQVKSVFNGKYGDKRIGINKKDMNNNSFTNNEDNSNSSVKIEGKFGEYVNNVNNNRNDSSLDVNSINNNNKNNYVDTNTSLPMILLNTKKEIKDNKYDNINNEEEDYAMKKLNYSPYKTNIQRLKYLRNNNNNINAEVKSYKNKRKCSNSNKIVYEYYDLLSRQNKNDIYGNDTTVTKSNTIKDNSSNSNILDHINQINPPLNNTISIPNFIYKFNYNEETGLKYIMTNSNSGIVFDNRDSIHFSDNYKETTVYILESSKVNKDDFVNKDNNNNNNYSTLLLNNYNSSKSQSILNSKSCYMRKYTFNNRNILKKFSKEYLVYSQLLYNYSNILEDYQISYNLIKSKINNYLVSVFNTNENKSNSHMKKYLLIGNKLNLISGSGDTKKEGTKPLPSYILFIYSNFLIQINDLLLKENILFDINKGVFTLISNSGEVFQSNDVKEISSIKVIKEKYKLLYKILDGVKLRKIENI